MSDAEDRPLSDLLLGDDEPQASHVPNSEHAAPAPRERDVYDELIEDPQVRPAIKDELKRRLLPGGGDGPVPQPSPVQVLRTEFESNRTWLNEFQAKPEDQRDYNEYAVRLRRNSELAVDLADQVAQQTRLEMGAARSGEVVNTWLADAIRAEKAQYGRSELEAYQGKVRELASRLPTNVLSDANLLRQQLQYYVEPNALKQHLNERRSGQRQQPRQSGEAYMDSDRNPDTVAQETNNPYPNANAEEQRFLRGLGLLKPEHAPGVGRDLIPVDGGFIIPVNPGRRNQGGQ